MNPSLTLSSTSSARTDYVSRQAYTANPDYRFGVVFCFIASYRNHARTTPSSRIRRTDIVQRFLRDSTSEKITLLPEGGRCIDSYIQELV